MQPSMIPRTVKGLHTLSSFKIPSPIHYPAEAQASECGLALQEGKKKCFFLFCFDRPHPA